MKNSIRMIAAGAALTAPVFLGACTPHDNLPDQGDAVTPEQTTSLDKSFRLGRMGLEAYQDALEVERHADAGDDFMSFEETNLRSFLAKSIPLGKSLKIGSDVYGTLGGEAGSANDTTTITPTSTSKVSIVTYAKKSQNMTYKAHESMTLTNPDETFFEDDTASPKEMQAFYRDSQTKIEEAIYYNDDAVNGVVDFRAKRSDDVLRIELSEKDYANQDVTPDFDDGKLLKEIREEVLYEY